MAKQPTPNGSSKQFIVICNKPGLKFTYEKDSPEWLSLKEDEKNNRLQRRYPHIKNPTAGDCMTVQMLADMTKSFDEHGEYVTSNKEYAVAAFNAARGSDPYARLHSTSLPIEDKHLTEIKPHEPGYRKPQPHGPGKWQGFGHQEQYGY